MVRRIVLALAFVAALGFVGVGAVQQANAHGGFGRRAAVSYGGYGFGLYQTGGYQAAAIRMGAYTPVYYNTNYGYGGGYHYDAIPHGNHFDVVPHYGGHYPGTIYFGF